MILLLHDKQVSLAKDKALNVLSQRQRIVFLQKTMYYGYGKDKGKG